ncbi:glycosyltransferase family 39 protein [Microbacterium deminutum]
MALTAPVRIADTVSARQFTGSASLGRAAAAVGVLAALISLAGSWIPSLWGDEAASVLSATRPVGSLLAMLTHVDAVHGAYYLGLHAWTDVFGSSPFSVRLPSAIAIGVCAAAVTWLCGRFGSRRFAILAGVFAAILPRLTYAGEEARAYAFDAAITAVLCVILAELMLRREPRSTRMLWMAYAATLAIGIYAFLYVSLMILAAGVVVLCTPHLRQEWRRWVVSSAAAGAIAAPVFVLAFIERSQIAFLAHRNVVNPDAVLVKMWFGDTPFAVLAWALVAVAVGGFAMDAVRSRRAGVAMGARLEVIALAWLVIPVAILLVASPFVAGYTARYGTFAAPAAAVLMAIGVRRIARMRWLAAVAIAAVLASAAPIWVDQRQPYAKNQSDWNEIAATIHSRAVMGDGIVFDEAVRPSRRPHLALDTNPAAFAAVRDVALETPFAASDTWHGVAFTIPEAARLGRFDGVRRLWVVEYSTGVAADTSGLSDLEALGYHRADRIELHRSVVYLYTR